VPPDVRLQWRQQPQEGWVSLDRFVTRGLVNE
jgi:hypothetical protein